MAIKKYPLWTKEQYHSSYANICVTIHAMNSEQIQTTLITSVKDGSFVKLVLNGYCGSEEQLKAVYVRRIVIKKRDQLSFTFRYKTCDIVKNFDFNTAFIKLANMIAKDFRKAQLFTTGFDLTLEHGTLRKSQPTQTELPSTNHDRSKKRLISTENKTYLQELGISAPDGKVLSNSQNKFRQINKYVEILSTLIKGTPSRIVDMGSGKGYLTFALYDYLITTLNLKPQVTGVELRPDLVTLCNDIAQRSGFDDLNFIQGTISSYDANGTDILIALHACDTATDDAIAKGIAANAELIVVAPCCHKQMRREMAKGKVHNDLDFLTRHGIFAEREAEMVTDSIRALILEYLGYNVKVFEFISDAHTPKNVMITATKNAKATRHDPAILEKIKAAMNYFGISRHHLLELVSGR